MTATYGPMTRARCALPSVRFGDTEGAFWGHFRGPDVIYLTLPTTVPAVDSGGGPMTFQRPSFTGASGRVGPPPAPCQVRPRFAGATLPKPLPGPGRAGAAGGGELRRHGHRGLPGGGGSPRLGPGGSGRVNAGGGGAAPDRGARRAGVRRVRPLRGAGAFGGAGSGPDPGVDGVLRGG